MAVTLTLIGPAGFDKVIEQLLFDPTVIVRGLQEKLDRVGVDQRVKVAVRLLPPSVPVMTADVSAPIVPAVALKPAVMALAATVTLAGTLSMDEVEFNDTVVFVETGCERVIWQETVAPDIMPLGLQDSEDTWTEAVKMTVVFAELLL